MGALKSFVYFIIKNTPVMRVMRFFLRPFIHKPGVWSFAFRLPLVGKQDLKLPGGKSLLLETDKTDDIYKILFWRGFEGFEIETVRLFLHLAKKSKVIFDIGANTGYFSLLGAKIDPKAKIYGFEPLPAALKAFKHNVKINRIKNIEIVSKAVSNEKGTLTLYVPKGDIPTSSSLVKGFREAAVEIKVPTITLDMFCKQKKIRKIDLIKIDTEGAEHFAFQGSDEILKRDHPIIICEVLGGDAMKWHQKNLPKYGYEFYHITEEGLKRKKKLVGGGEDMNYIFIRKQDLPKIKKFIK